MMDTRRLIEQVGEQAPFPHDAFERMLHRRDRKQRNQRLAAIGISVAVLVAIAVAALAVGSFDRTAHVPGSSPTETGPVFTFFGPAGMVAIDGVRIKTTSQHPSSPKGTPEDELDPRYVLDPMIDVPAGARFEVGQPGFRVWVDAFDLSEPAQRLYEVDLAASPSMPQEPGTYYLEFEFPPDSGLFSSLVPIRVVAPEEMGLAFWFDFDGISPLHNLVTMNGVPIEGTMTNGPEHVYGYRWDPVVDVPPGASIVVKETGVTGEITGWINAEGSPGSPHLYELDLASGTASMPTEPGNYIVEIHVPDPPGGAYFTDLFPVRVVAPWG